MAGNDEDVLNKIINSQWRTESGKHETEGEQSPLSPLPQVIKQKYLHHIPDATPKLGARQKSMPMKDYQQATERGKISPKVSSRKDMEAHPSLKSVKKVS